MQENLPTLQTYTGSLTSFSEMWSLVQQYDVWGCFTLLSPKGDLVSLQYLKWSSLWQKDIPTSKVFSWRTQPWKSQGFGILPLIFIHLNIVVFLFLHIEYFIGIGYSFTNVAFSPLPIFYRALNSSFCLQLTRFFSI